MMKRPVLIFGINPISEMVYDSICRQGDTATVKMEGFVVDDRYYRDKSYCGMTVYPYSKAVAMAKDFGIIVCVGYGGMNSHRQEVFMRLKDDGWCIENYIDPTAKVHTDKIGTGNVILEDVHIDVKANIGDGNIFAARTLIGHHNVVGNFNFFSYNVIIAGAVHIGDRCFLGINSTIQNNIVLADETLVGGGGYISEDICEGGKVYAPTRSRCLSHPSKYYF